MITPAELLNAAKCFCFSPGDSNAIKTYLLTQASQCTDPLAPTNLTVGLVTDTSISISWTEPLQIPPVTINKFIIKWGTTSGVYTFSAMVGGTTFGYSMTGLTPGTNYFIVVQAVSGACESANSAELSTSTSAPGNGLLTGLLGYWKLDEASNVNRADATGNGFTATQAGGNVAAAAGIINNGASFPAGNQGLSVPANIDTRAQTTPFSIQFWSNPTAFNAFFAFCATHSAGGTKGFLFYTANNGGLHFYSTDDAGTVTDSGMTTTLLTQNAWNHVVAVFDGTLVNAYVNGVINGAGQALLGLGITKGQGVFMIGNYSDLVAGVTETCDEVGYWDRALSATDVATLYNAGAGLPFSSFT